MERKEFKPGDIIKHFKRETVEDKTNRGYLYEYIGVGYHSETKEKLVVYKSLYGNEDIEFGHICCRPYDMFYSKVDNGKYPDIRQEYRFEIYGGD